ncbi:hypothetical protein GE107_15640 [Cohnella sp. CFH 77786]|uniref:hypothetical protein n=1 Tax=Cohnella sp. CFH 77786 TaxID=2662265 RepID=UPI001C60C030|nr:hypothetical protein [Cohnella sp. CFH 77786]MBW5447490.1 hypothetical protein [Cohnella sp. CFH 77786]
MSIKYTRDYDKILDDLSRAISTIPRFYQTFEMDDGDWTDLDENEKAVCLRTLADDVFYVLGSDPSAPVGPGLAEYDRAHGVIKVTAGPQLVHVVSLRE